MKPWAKAFYSSRQWKETRRAVMARSGGLCEECLKEGRITPAVIVHHKTHLTKENINDPDIALNTDNLESVCRDCHAVLHGSIDAGRRYTIDKNTGRVIIK